MIFNLFKKKEKPIELKQIVVKRKSNSEMHIGQIVSIDAEMGNSNENYYLSTYENGNISNKITSEYRELCQNYKYAIIKAYTDEKIDARVICCDGFLQRYKIQLDKEYENGSAFIVKDGELYDNNVAVGKIVDNRYDPSVNITFSELENDKLVAFIRK